MKCSTGRVCWYILTPCCLLTSLILVGAAVTIFLLYPSLLAQQVQEKVTIVPGHLPFEQFQDPSVPMYKDIYFFNLTNAEEFANGARPRVEEVGPYSFRECRQKFFNDSNLSKNRTLLEYTQLKTYHFSKETSQGNENDIICTVNMPMVGAINLALNLTGLLRVLGIPLIKTIFDVTDAKLYVCQPAKDLVFNYTDALIKELHNNSLLRLFKMNLPTDYISIQQNASINDSYPSIIHTGVGDIDRLAEFVQWDGLQDLGVWPEESANKINGTEGLVFRPNLKEGDELTAFVDDVLRSFPLEYIDKVKLKGLDSYQYMLPQSVFKSAFTNPENARWGSWCPDGLIYLGVIQKPNAPVYGSKPRFLDADPEQTSDQIDPFLRPDREKHDTFVYVHPMIGATLQFNRRLQLNLQINQTDEFKQLKNINGTIYFPILYIDENAVLTDDYKDLLMKNGLKELQTATDIVYASFALLLFLAVVAMIVYLFGIFKIKKYCARNDYEPIT